MTLNIVVVGGVAGGATAAAKARRQNEKAHIQVFEMGEYISFANCGLPYFIGDEIHNVSDLILTTPEKFASKYNLEVHTSHQVMSINREKKEIEVLKIDSNELFWVPYDRLILSQGAAPLKPPLKGVEQDYVFSLRTIPDMLSIDRFIQEKSPKSAAVIGGGFIGLEMAEAFHRRGLKVSVIEASPHIFPRLEMDFAKELEGQLAREHFQIYSAKKVVAIEERALLLDDGSHLAADLVLLSVGVKPENLLAQNAGLEIGDSGGVKTNGRMQSSDPDIYVVGDMAEVRHAQTGAPLRMPLAGPANRQGRIAGANAAGGHLTYGGVLGTSILRCLNLTVGMVGLNTKDAQKAQLNYSISVTRNPDHASYYPGASGLNTLLIAEEGSGRILGAQIMGEKGVDKRIDVFATAITGNLTVDDLESIDLAYAPPFGTANDPVNTSAFVMGHELRGDIVTHCPTSNCPDICLLDVRNPSEIEAQGRLKGAINIPLPDLRVRLGELDPEKPLLVYCQKGQRGYLATRLLMGHGFQDVRNLKGGFLQARFNDWQITS